MCLVYIFIYSLFQKGFEVLTMKYIYNKVNKRESKPKAGKRKQIC